jgi:DNA-directed RNA polymerase subunit RPC12/RpoP
MKELDSNLYTRYRNMPQFKNLSDERIREMIEQASKAKVDTDSLFEDVKEKKLAKEMAKRYTDEYSIESVADKNTLRQLIFMEVVGMRIQRMLNEFYRDNKAVPMQLMDALNKNNTQIIALKETLGLTKDQQKTEQTDAQKALEVLKRKFKQWRSENQASRTIVCPECSKMILLKMKTDAWESFKHPYFIDRLLGNKPLFALIKDGRLTCKEVAEILGTSEDYVNWVIEKTQPKIQEVVAIDNPTEVVEPAVLVEEPKEEVK